MKIVVQNSYSKIDGEVPLHAEELIRQVLTYQNDIESEVGQMFYKMKSCAREKDWKTYHACKAKIKHLQENQYVCLYKNKTFPTGLLNVVLESLGVLSCPYHLEDLRERISQSEILRWNNVPFTPRYYQKDMIELGLKNGRGVCVSAVGTGKSLIMAYLIKEISVTSLIIVPSVALSGQLYNDFCEWFGYQNIQLLDAAKIRKLGRPKPINIVTVQSLGSLKKTGEFKEFAKKIDAIYVDELHHAGAATYTGLLDDLDHVYYRYGFTGTFLRNDNKTLEMWSFLSNVLYEYPAHKAIQEGFLTPIEVNVYKLPGRGHKKYQKEYDNNYCAQTGDIDSNNVLLKKVYNICTSVPAGSQILILVNRKDKCGAVIHEYLSALGVNNSYISGDNGKDEINNTIKAFNEKKVQVLIGSSVIGEGIDVRSTDHLIMCQGGKSEVTMVQAIGRAIRLFEGKKLAFIHDFEFINTYYMYKHLEERVEIYQRNFQCPVHYHQIQPE